eukprot:TRINITY_DN22374_c0_g1_i1.p1 TRINITY_DN22374_c0_g1~~TRINITY_DN22374_c0_g1_i1.p1  ORF type:complete len:584 (+),score=182.22 TRINITY_DN22374_c0_g1_i1:119-1753(+)
MEEGSTTAPPLLTEPDLVTLMDKNKIGTDATIAEHIHKIQERKYAVLDGREFKPTTLGEALVAGYNYIGLRLLSQPQLRAKTESDMKEITEQKKTKEEVLKENIDMYRKIFDDITKDAPKLDKALAKYFTPLGTHFDEEVQNFSKCGKCSESMHMRSVEGRSTLFCENCKVGYRMPQNDGITTIDQECPLCSFQVLSITSTKDKKYNICPYCYNNPPQDIENSNSMPCFKCTANCPLAGGTGAALPLFPCPQCSKNMVLKKKKDNKGFFISCEGFPNCSKSLWLPKELTTAEATTTICSRCDGTKKVSGGILSAGGSGPFRKIKVTFDKAAIIPGQPSQWLACLGGCDEMMNEYLSDANQRFSTWAATAQQKPTSTFTKQTNPPQTYSKKKTFSGHFQEDSFQDTDFGPPKRAGPPKSNFTQSKSWAPPPKAVQGKNGEEVFCNCGSLAMNAIVKKEGPNQGRPFFTCVTKACNFFAWGDDNGPQAQQSFSKPSKPPPKPTKRKATHKTDSEKPAKKHKSEMKCSLCKQTGHNKRSCPNKDEDE